MLNRLTYLWKATFCGPFFKSYLGEIDFTFYKEVMDLLTELNKEGTTIVMVTHSQKDAACAQRIVNLFDGQIVSDVKNEL